MRCRVVIAGGGVAALEAVLALRDLAAEEVQVDVFAPRRDFVYRPYAVGVPYGVARVSRYDLADLTRRGGAAFHLDSIAAVEPEARVAVTHDGDSFAYDYLVLAPGAQRLWPVPGAVTFWGLADELEVTRLVGQLRSGWITSLAFTMPSAHCWSLPLYELALLAEAETARAGRRVRLTVVTPEDTPLQIFGRRASELTAALLAERGIGVLTGTHPVRFERGALRIVPGEPFAADAAVSLPKLEGRRVRGIAHDAAGFLRVDEHCRVRGHEHVFAAGDVTSFPVKQGGIATQQADVIAAAIAADAGAPVDPQRFDPVLRGVLWTGEAPRYLEGRLGGGHGETSSLTAEPPWGESEGKIVGRYLTPFIAALDRAAAPLTSETANPL